DKIAGQSKTLAAIADIKDAFDPKLMQVPARVQNTITDWASWLGLDPNAGQKDLLERQTNLFQQVHQMFNAYRKEITGAAASVQELASLRKAMIDVDQSPIVFQAALKNFENQAKRGLRINNMLLREGISNNHKDYGRRFDDVNLGGGDDDMDLRYNDLLAKYPNESEEAILDRLIDEGYAGG
ncbi:MAG: hypothetical protein GY941_16555, partial [Planctomycetes bacterium]|nr:hypothetical protein [Planctomycetota bacterium]